MKKRFAASAIILAMSAATVLSPLTAFAETEEQELNIAIFQGGYGDAYWNQMVELFEESHEGVKVNMTISPTIGDIIRPQIVAGNVPDFICLNDGGEDGVILSLIKEHALLNLNDVFDGENYAGTGTLRDDITDGILASSKCAPYGDGDIYLAPFNSGPQGLIYNKTFFDENNLEVPKTWDEFIDILQKIKDAGEQPLLMTYKDAWTANAPWNSIAADLAPESFADDRKAGETTFVGTHEEITEKYLTLLDYAQDDFMGLSYDDGNKKFANGDAVMIINGNWAISQYRNANPDVKINMFAIPSSNDESQNKVTSGVDVLLGVSKSSSNVDAAKDFVSFMMEKENVQTYIDEQFSFSALKGVEQSDEAVSGVQEDISNGKVANFEDHYYPSGFDMSALLTELSLNRANGMDDKENIEQFLKQCDEKYDVANVD